MITFLPYANVKKSIEALDVNTLRQQRIDAKSILNILSGKHPNRGLHYHPAVMMWRGCEEMLKGYLEECVMEYIRRGRVNRMVTPSVNYPQTRVPYWWGGPMHGTHRAALMKQNPGWYNKFGWKEPSGQKIHWPIKSNGKLK